MVATIAAGTTAGYYLSQSEYYVGGSEPPGTWIAADAGFGMGAGDEVRRDSFERLHSGLGLEGQILLTNGGRVDRVPGYDITFSAPKSVSVLWALGDDSLRHAIDAAQQEAVAAAVALVERNAAFSRRGKGGTRSEPVRLTVAAFRHGEARPALHEDGTVFGDPQLHTHAVILNLARRADGTVGTLDGRRLFTWKMAAGAAYHLELASRLQRLGFSLADIGRNGTFEVEGVEKRLCAYFSARRGEVEALLEEAGTASAAAPALAAAIAKTSRAAKTEAAAMDRHQLWKDRAKTFGPELRQLVEAVERADERSAERDLLNRERKRDRAPAAEVVAELLEHQSFFDRRHLIAALASAAVGTGLMADHAEAEADWMLGEGELVELRPDPAGERRFSTPGMIAIERGVQAMATRLAALPGPAFDTGLLARLLEENAVSEEQRTAALAVASGGRIAVMEGTAGSGKSTTLRPLVEALKAAGLTVGGSATAWRIARQLGEDLGIESRATDSWIARRDAGRPFADRNTVLIVDEAGQLSSRQMHALLCEAERSGAKLVLVGDRRQLQPVGAGGALTIVSRAVEVAEVHRVVRQRETWMRGAIMALAEGRTGTALAAIERKGLIRYGETSAGTVAVMADAVDEARLRGDGQAPLLLARTNAQVRRINDEVRKRRRERGFLHGEEIVVPAVTSSGQAHELRLCAGDEIRFLVRNDRLGVVNGTAARILDITVEAGAPTVAAQVGEREISFAPLDLSDGSGRTRLAHAYATTFYSAQGLTCENALVLLDPVCDRHDTYVALSRARGRTEIFVDRSSVDLAIRSDEPLSRRATLAELDDAKRTKWLGRQLSRSAVKGTTLDLLPASDVGRENGAERTAAKDELQRGMHALER
jgi:conjugative relaxase-like TrwC/TraI family protein